jgi:uncharacterized protein YdhG (YjbR/CyaY superfamily)
MAKAATAITVNSLRMDLHDRLTRRRLAGILAPLSEEGNMAATTVVEYLAALPADRRAVVSAVRDAVNASLQPGFEEGIQYGGIGWYVPHRLYAPGYHCDPKQPLNAITLTSNKSGVSLHMMCLYCDGAAMERFVGDWKASGKKLDMGKGCVRFKTIDAVPLDAVRKMVAGLTVEGYLAAYVPKIPASARKKAAK